MPSTLTSKSEAASREESKVTSSQHDDDLGEPPRGTLSGNYCMLYMTLQFLTNKQPFELITSLVFEAQIHFKPI